MRFFTVKWPFFARFEALFRFAVMVAAFGQAGGVRTIFSKFSVVSLPRAGLSETAAFWLSVTLLMAVPYLCAMIVVDRLLTVRRGFGILSVLGAAVWASIAAAAAADGALGTVSACHAALFVGIVSLLVHGRILWIGLSDGGFVGLRLIARSWTRDNLTRRMNDGPSLAPNPRGRTTTQPRRGYRAAAAVWFGVFTAGIAGYLLFYELAPAPPAFIASPGTLRENLLGQSFLKNLRQVLVESDRVVLTAN